MSVRVDIQEILTTTTNITDKVSKYVFNAITYPMIYGSYVIPKENPTDNGKVKTTVEDTTIIHYLSSPINLANPVNAIEYVISCRAEKQDDCLNLQMSVANAFDKVRGPSGNTFFTVELLPIIVPLDNTDNFNGVVRLKAVGSY